MSDPSLVEERDVLLRSLRDLETEHAAGELDDTDYLALKDDYTARAAAVLRRLEAGSSNAPARDPATAGFRTVVPVGRATTVRKRVGSRGRLVAGAVVLALLAGGVGYAVAQSSGQRLAGEGATGSLPEGSVDRITKAQVLVSEGKILDAVKVYDDLLTDDPENPVALAQRGWLLSRVDPSLVDSGLASIDRAIAIDPTYPEAHFFRGMILWRVKDEPALGVESFQRAIDAKPPADVLAQIESVRQQAQADADARASGSTTTPPSP